MKKRKRSFAEKYAEDAESSDDADEEKGGRTSIKRSFIRKALGPIIGYNSDFSLLSFVYDLSMWSKLGATRHSAKKIPLRLALKTGPYSPLYWQTRHQALLDLQRHCGFPVLFKTKAPWEFSFPYHAWILDEMNKTGCDRQQMAGPETIHTAHVFQQVELGLYCGANKRPTKKQKGWTDHILADPSMPRLRSSLGSTSSSDWSSKMVAASCRPSTTTAAGASIPML